MCKSQFQLDPATIPTGSVLKPQPSGALTANASHWLLLLGPSVPYCKTRLHFDFRLYFLKKSALPLAFYGRLFLFYFVCASLSVVLFAIELYIGRGKRKEEEAKRKRQNQKSA